MTNELTVTNELPEPCFLCGGTGKVSNDMFVTGGSTQLRTCGLCGGRGTTTFKSNKPKTEEE